MVINYNKKDCNQNSKIYYTIIITTMWFKLPKLKEDQ